MSFEESDNLPGLSMPPDDSAPDSSPHACDSDDSSDTEQSDAEYTSSTSFVNPNVNPSTNNPTEPNCTSSVYSSFFPERGTIIEIRENGKTIQVTRPYGIGIDTHKCFLAVTVIVNSELQYIRFQQDFPTTSAGIISAKNWALNIIASYCNPPVNDNEPLHYTIESTATFHYPVLKLWEGQPSVVNPTLAKAGRRKTDRIDSQTLASNDIVAYWPVSFVPDEDVNELRVLVNEREYTQKLATKTSNRLVNTLTRFGFTIAREGSITSNPKIREIVEGLIADPPIVPDEFHLNAIPEQTRAMLREDFELFESFNQRVKEYQEKMISKARSMSWETGEGFISGAEMIDLLMTAPQVGEITAVAWMAYIVTPMRFPNAKALAAYCGLDPSVKTSAGKKTSDQKRGGNKALHKQLCSSANRLISFPREMFGRWGNNMCKKGTSRNRARNAVARKLAVALFYMTLYNKPFSYDKYTLTQDMVLLDIPLTSFEKMVPKFHRYVHILNANGIFTTAEMIRSYMTCSLDGINGLGPNFNCIVRDLIANQRDYRDNWNKLVNDNPVPE